MLKKLLGDRGEQVFFFYEMVNTKSVFNITEDASKPLYYNEEINIFLTSDFEILFPFSSRNIFEGFRFSWGKYE